MLIENLIKVVSITVDAHIKFGIERTKEKKNSFKPYTLHITGDTGIGKTESVIDTCTEKNIPCMIINPAQKTDTSDINGLPEKISINGRIVTVTTLQEFLPVEKVKEDGSFIKRKDGGTMIDLKSIKNYIDNYEEIIDFYNGDINQAPGLVIFWDEVNRTFAKDIQQLLFKVFLEHKLNNYTFPKGICLIASSNPDNGKFDVAPIMREPAFKGRFLHIEATNNKKGFLKYGIKNDYDPLILKVVNKYEGAIKTPEEGFLRELKIIPNHRSWRTVNTLLKYTNLISLGREIYEEVLAGVLGYEMARITCDEMEEESENFITGEEIITNYREVRPLFLEIINRSKVRTELINASGMSLVFALSLEENMKKLQVKENLDNIYLFFKDIPNDLRISLGEDLRLYKHAKKILVLHSKLYELLIETKKEAFERK